MATDLIINATSYEIRIALIEHGNLVEFYLERPTERGLVGNIYKGKVVRVLPGMQAAFVDIGLERTGFLYVDDIHVSVDSFAKRYQNGDGEGDCSCCHEASEESLGNRVPGKGIEDMLTEGQEILVQICKEPMGTKGARLTGHITLPCRNLVFMPMTDHIGISRKIEGDDVREKLRRDIEQLRPAGTGFIVRTVAEGASPDELEADMEFLLHLWSEIQDTAEKTPCMTLVYEDLDIILRVVRDIFSPTVDRVVVDDQNTYQRVIRFVETFVPHLRPKVHLYESKAPIFTTYGVEMDINRALARKIWLRCGGYIIIEATEALTVIDVNTGRYVGKTDLEETIFKTNMEAVKEIAYQLRLRNIGGIIIIDFIDMESEEHREEVFCVLSEALKQDKSRTNILKFSEFGLIQLTRKRNKDDLTRVMCEPCQCCNGSGLLKSARTICYEIFRKISRDASSRKASTVTVNVNPRVASMILKDEAMTIKNIEDEIKMTLAIFPNRELHMEKYEICWDTIK
ncbi:MAG: Rne/Rng family ribonuclease [Desulfobulbaceae bacterium]|nr:Rne/Rng family ribonuclease [Desulfobulbaceae bacterium]